MFVLVFISFFVGLRAKTEYDKLPFHFKPEKSIRTIKELNLNDSYFSSLENYHVDAEQVTEASYPWVARVIHSRNKNIPHVCTAVCIDPAIFITAARCIYTLKVNYTTVIYRGKRLHALAFVVPTEMSKQGFDDIGFIVVRSKSIKRWAVIELFNINRTDSAFRWFANLDFTYGNINSKVVGYAAEKNQQQSWSPEIWFNLTALNVIVGLDICPKLLTDRNKLSKAFYVPCYYACSFSQFLRDNDECSKYHGVEGGAVYDTLSKKLLGIATWGAFSSHLELPVGFAFANSANFFKDYTCARRIRNDNALLITNGYYQSLCNMNLFRK